MTVVLDHHIIPVRDKDESARFLSGWDFSALLCWSPCGEV